MTIFLSAEWRDLVMLNFEVDPSLLKPLVPRGTALDLWQGRALVSLVGFRFTSTRVLGIRVPLHQHFDEVNLRFYVRRRVGDDVRRAVVFLRELVPRRAIAWIARARYNEPYRAVPMRHWVHTSGDTRHLRYEWRERGRWVGLQASTEGPAATLSPGSEAEFITEHYWGHTRQRDGGTVEYEVRHPRWRAWTASGASTTGDLSATYGTEFGRILSGTATSAFVAEGSAVSVGAPRRLAAAELTEGIDAA